MMQKQAKSHGVLPTHSKRVKEYLNLTISIGISNRFETLNESKQSVDRAKEALYYRVNTGPSSIIFIRKSFLLLMKNTY